MQSLKNQTEVISKTKNAKTLFVFQKLFNMKGHIIKKKIFLHQQNKAIIINFWTHIVMLIESM